MAVSDVCEVYVDPKTGFSTARLCAQEAIRILGRPSDQDDWRLRDKLIIAMAPHIDAERRARAPTPPPAPPGEVSEMPSPGLIKHYKQAAREIGNLFCWCVQNLPKFPPPPGKDWLDDLKERLKATPHTLAQASDEQFIPAGHHIVEDADGQRFVKNDPAPTDQLQESDFLIERIIEGKVQCYRVSDTGMDCFVESLPTGGKRLFAFSDGWQRADGKAAHWNWAPPPTPAQAEPGGEGLDLPNNPGCWEREGVEYFVLRGPHGTISGAYWLAEIDHGHDLPETKLLWHGIRTDTFPRGGWHMLYPAIHTRLEGEIAAYRERDAQMKDRLDGVYGALADAATVIVRMADPGESVRELTRERDSAQQRRAEAEAEASNWKRKFSDIPEYAGLSESDTHWWNDKPHQLVRDLRKRAEGK